MNPKEKAEELVDKFYWIFGDGYLGDQHIQCALIAVNECLNLVRNNEELYFWEQVKQEIEKLWFKK